jgi:hypothetical protein
MIMLAVQDKVDAPTADARRLRRNVLRGAVLVFVTAGYSGKRFIFEQCKKLGVRSVVIDGPDSWSQQLVKDGLADSFVGLDFGDADTLFERLLEECKKVRLVPIISRLRVHYVRLSVRCPRSLSTVAMEGQPFCRPPRSVYSVSAWQISSSGKALRSIYTAVKYFIYIFIITASY